MNDVYLGRQPIYDREMSVYAYELLFRSDEANRANIDNPDLATTQLIVNTLTEFGLRNVVGEVPAFINLTESFVLGRIPIPDQHEHLILEILETIELNEEVLNGILKLKKTGYRIALDDFIFHPHLAPLVDIADIVKLDVMNMTHAELHEHIRQLRKYPVKLLAEKVETQEMYNDCKQLGFDFFQGYFFCKPKIMQGKQLPANRLALLNLLSKLCNPDLSIQQLEQLVIQDVSLSYRLLHYINSSQYSLQHKIDSVSKAVMLLGLDTVRNIVSLIALSGVKDKPFELFATALQRAHMCEQLGQQKLAISAAACFTVGLFSVLDAIMDQPMQEILRRLPLSDDITQALLQYRGELGKTLESVIAYEQGEWLPSDMNPYTTEELRTVFLHTLHWCGDFIHSIQQLDAA